jgi:hypothetical protein
VKPAHAVWALVGLLIVAHQDVWFWDDARLVFGFLPITLAYHAGISLAAAGTWYLATLFCWPIDEATPPATKEERA